MPKTKLPLTEVLPTSPTSLVCPFCNALPQNDCIAGAGGFSAVHVARIKAAAAVDKKKKHKAN